jgi:cell division protein FtsZ
MGILTVAVVTKPFDFEGKKQAHARRRERHRGAAQHVDSLIVVLNDKLLDVLGDDASSMRLPAADNVLRNAVGGIAEIINVPGLVNVDFAGRAHVMGEMGMAMMGSAEAAGMDRARIAAEQAVASPLLEASSCPARAACWSTSPPAVAEDEGSARRDEDRAGLRRRRRFVKSAPCSTTAMEDRLRVTVVATGLGAPRAAAASR